MAHGNAAQVAKLARSTVLVISGNKFVVEVVRTVLFGLGMRDVAIATEPVAAAERAHLMPFDLLIVDTGPATFDGLAILRDVRNLPDARQAGMPAIALVTPGNEPPLQDLVALAVAHTIPKPIATAPLVRAVTMRLLAGGQTEGEGAAPRGSERRALTTLLVSSNPFTAQMVRVLLLQLGLADVAVARNGAEADQHVAATPFDFVVADCGPASIDGLAVVEGLRARCDTATARAPVLLLATKPNATFIARARAAQIKAVVTKPLEPALFVERARKALGG